MKPETTKIQTRLEYLRGELRAERISYGELAELKSLAPHIKPDDVELLEAAGVPEFPEDTNDVKNLRLQISDCGKTLESCGLVSVTVAKLNPCGSLTSKEQKEIAGRIVLACNHHEELVSTLEDVQAFARLSCPQGVDRDLWQSTFNRVESVLSKIKGTK